MFVALGAFVTFTVLYNVFKVYTCNTAVIQLAVDFLKTYTNYTKGKIMALDNTHFGAKKIKDILSNKKSIFFIGVGGVNMSSLALISHNRGFCVGGSDRTRTDVTDGLEEHGIKVSYGHNASNVEGYDAVVYTVAISSDNPEYVRANELGIPCISRADYLGYIMMGYDRRIGVSGMHGKSTCTSMCATVFMSAGADPTVLSGAAMPAMNGAYRIGESENFIFEACEYMDSFLSFYPTVAIILNVEMDHVDYFKSMEHIYSSFSSFANIAHSFLGYAVYNIDDENTVKALKNYSGKRISVSTENEKADLYARNIVLNNGAPEFDVMLNGEFFFHTKLSVSGYHNVYNALATAAAAYLSGIEGDKIAKGLSMYTGANRRMEYKGKLCGALVFDDYGHHPTEIKTTLDGASKMGYNRTFCVYQPHTYSRTKGLYNDFLTAFSSVDEVIFADIYAAREKDDGTVSSKMLASDVENGSYVGDLQNIVEYLKRKLCEGDLLVVMGAGDIYKIYDLMSLED